MTLQHETEQVKIKTPPPLKQNNIVSFTQIKEPR